MDLADDFKRVASALARLEQAVTASNNAQRLRGIAGAAVDTARDAFVSADAVLGDARQAYIASGRAVEAAEEELRAAKSAMMALALERTPPTEAFTMDDGPAYVGIFGW